MERKRPPVKIGKRKKANQQCPYGDNIEERLEVVGVTKRGRNKYFQRMTASNEIHLKSLCNVLKCYFLLKCPQCNLEKPYSSTLLEHILTTHLSRCRRANKCLYFYFKPELYTKGIKSEKVRVPIPKPGDGLKLTTEVDEAALSMKLLFKKQICKAQNKIIDALDGLEDDTETKERLVMYRKHRTEVAEDVENCLEQIQALRSSRALSRKGDKPVYAEVSAQGTVKTDVICDNMAKDEEDDDVENEHPAGDDNLVNVEDHAGGEKECAARDDVSMDGALSDDDGEGDTGSDGDGYSCSELSDDSGASEVSSVRSSKRIKRVVSDSSSEGDIDGSSGGNADRGLGVDPLEHCVVSLSEDNDNLVSDLSDNESGRPSAEERNRSESPNSVKHLVNIILQFQKKYG